MTRFKPPLIIATLMFAAVLIYAATKPDVFRVERSISIKAAPEAIYPYLSDLHQFALWSPYEKLDPQMKRSFSGAPSGKGAIYEWEGNNKVGHGRMEITAANAPSDVMLQLDFFSPVQAHNLGEFRLRPQGQYTTVTWSMSGPAPYLSKLMTIFFSMDQMVGGQFEEGLRNLKARVEQSPASS
ncbi:MAG TPA: SRPBCC family protein [Oxalicibacterium sp.]|jgi:uncharacterized protein YndB with AHSA1/START domain|nr:SRPBCC family protein [Oxalicibacterium sp.]